MHTQKTAHNLGHTDVSRFGWLLLVIALAVSSLLTHVQSASAQTCFADTGNLPGNISCTANDVQTTLVVTPVNNDTCTGPNDTITLQMEVTWHANANRYDVGLFVAQDGGNAKTGSCFQAIGDVPPFTNLDSGTPGDTCGDIDGGSNVTQVEIVTVSCSSAVNGRLQIPACRTWKQPGDNNFCNDIGDSAGTGSKCDCTPFATNIVVPPDPCAGVTCNDGNPCTDDACNPANGQCVYTNDDTNTCSDGKVCTDGDACTAGQCLGSPVVCKDDGNACTDEVCTEPKGCASVPDDSNTCSDGKVCTDGDVCKAGQCLGSPVVCKDDGNACTDEVCTEPKGCASVPDDSNTCSDGKVCTDGDKCTGGKCSGTPVVCKDDGNACTDEVCTEPKGCESVNDDTNTCGSSKDSDCDNPDTCKAGVCQPNNEPDGTKCTDEPDVCTDDLCKAGLCTHTLDATNDPVFCGFACRTPGFWGTHGTITDALLDAANGITVCGKPLNDIEVGQQDSAQEALCVAPKGNQRLQLARQLTSAKLTCLINSDGADADCTDAIEAKIRQCDAVCTDQNSLAATVTTCITEIDAFNNGVSPLSLGCHDRPLPDPYNPPGSATTSSQCNAANKNSCTIFGGC